MEANQFVENLRGRMTAALYEFNRILPRQSHVRIYCPNKKRPDRGLFAVAKLERQKEPKSYGRHGEMATNSREQQEATTLSLQLLQNCLMLINTILIQRTIDRQGLWARLQPEDFRALTPLFYGHINPYGLFELDLEGPSFLEAA